MGLYDDSCRSIRPKLSFHDHITNVVSLRRLDFLLRNSNDLQNMVVISLCSVPQRGLQQTGHMRKSKRRYPYIHQTIFLLGCQGYNTFEVRRSIKRFYEIKLMPQFIMATCVKCLLPITTDGAENMFRRSDWSSVTRSRMCLSVTRSKISKNANKSHSMVSWMNRE